MLRLQRGSVLLRRPHQVLAVAAVLGALGACQPTLQSNLPVSTAAYDAIGGVAPAPATSYYLRPGDRISVNLFQEPDLSQPDIIVDTAGAITLPLIGQVQVGGRSADEVARMIEQAYGGRYLRNPQASVSLRQAQPQTVTVDGQVVQPGVYEVQPGYTLLSAIALARGTDLSARFDEVLLFRMVDGQRYGGRFDINEIRAGRMPDPQVLPGDQVIVGYDSLRGFYRDILQASPLLGVLNQF